MKKRLSQKTCRLILGFFVFGYGCSSQSNISKPNLNSNGGKPSQKFQDEDLAAQEDQGGKTTPDSPDALDVGGYNKSDKQQTASSSQPTPISPSTTEPAKKTTPKPPPKGAQESERHPGQITFQSRLQPFTMNVTSLVGGKTVKAQEFKLGERDKAPLKIDSLCVTEGKTCLIVTVSGGVTQTAGKSGCAKAMIKSPTEVFINTDPDGRGIFGTCFDEPDDIEDAFTITCPQSQEVVLNDCT
jgi:hypothetical protein